MLAVHTPAPGTWLALAATGVAAIAEEAFFRRFLYGWLARWGEGMAVARGPAAVVAGHLRGGGGGGRPGHLSPGGVVWLLRGAPPRRGSWGRADARAHTPPRVGRGCERD